MTLFSTEFRAVYDEHFEFVWRSLRRLGVREADAMDLTQKVFLAVHMGWSEFEGRSKVRTWLFGICRRIASDYRRSSPIRREVVTDAAVLEVEGAEHDVPASAESRQRANVAEAILNRMPEPQRVVFVLFELEEMPGEQIAELLDLSIGTVRSRLRLARERFRREVKRLAAADPMGRKEAV
ncbi:MAG: sigma-70 family RNA polymerase sigma factor [Polyangiaceae bacterium]